MNVNSIIVTPKQQNSKEFKEHTRFMWFGQRDLCPRVGREIILISWRQLLQRKRIA